MDKTLLNERWQDYFAGLALAARRGSKDPSTKVGAVIYRDDRSTASTGFNGLPKGIYDSVHRLNCRSWKYPRMVHAEMNAIDYCNESMRGYGLVTTAHPCSVCALRIISKGISVVYYLPGLENEERWKEDMELAQALFRDANVSLFAMDKKMGA